MTNQAFPSLNGIEPSWADIAVTATASKIPLVEMSDLAAIKWSRKVDVGKKRGVSGGRVMGQTTGQGDQDASATLYRRGMRTLIKSLMSVAPTRGNQVLISLVFFTLDIQHTPPGETEIYHVRLKGCRYLGDSDDMKEGSDADKVDLTLNPIEIANIVNGKEVVLL